jgi:hypothetical protein
MDNSTIAGVMLAVDAYNMQPVLNEQADRVLHFARRAAELGYGGHEVCIVLLNADCPAAAPLANELMPGENWQQYRDAGALPFARGLAGRPFVQAYLELVNPAAAEVFKAKEGLPVLLMHNGRAAVYGVESAQPQQPASG